MHPTDDIHQLTSLYASEAIKNIEIIKGKKLKEPSLFRRFFSTVEEAFSNLRYNTRERTEISIKDLEELSSEIKSAKNELDRSMKTASNLHEEYEKTAKEFLNTERAIEQMARSLDSTLTSVTLLRANIEMGDAYRAQKNNLEKALAETKEFLQKYKENRVNSRDLQKRVVDYFAKKVQTAPLGFSTLQKINEVLTPQLLNFSKQKPEDVLQTCNTLATDVEREIKRYQIEESKKNVLTYASKAIPKIIQTCIHLSHDSPLFKLFEDPKVIQDFIQKNPHLKEEILTEIGEQEVTQEKVTGALEKRINSQDIQKFAKETITAHFNQMQNDFTATAYQIIDERKTSELVSKEELKNALSKMFKKPEVFGNFDRGEWTILNNFYENLREDWKLSSIPRNVDEAFRGLLIEKYPVLQTRLIEAIRSADLSPEKKEVLLKKFSRTLESYIGLPVLQPLMEKMKDLADNRTSLEKESLSAMQEEVTKRLKEVKIALQTEARKQSLHSRILRGTHTDQIAETVFRKLDRQNLSLKELETFQSNLPSHIEEATRQFAKEAVTASLKTYLEKNPLKPSSPHLPENLKNDLAKDFQKDKETLQELAREGDPELIQENLNLFNEKWNLNFDHTVLVKVKENILQSQLALNSDVNEIISVVNQPDLQTHLRERAKQQENALREEINNLLSTPLPLATFLQLQAHLDAFADKEKWALAVLKEKMGEQFEKLLEQRKNLIEKVLDLSRGQSFEKRAKEYFSEIDRSLDLFHEQIQSSPTTKLLSDSLNILNQYEEEHQDLAKLIQSLPRDIKEPLEKQFIVQEKGILNRDLSLQQEQIKTLELQNTPLAKRREEIKKQLDNAKTLEDFMKVDSLLKNFKGEFFQQIKAAYKINLENRLESLKIKEEKSVDEANEILWLKDPEISEARRAVKNTIKKNMEESVWRPIEKGKNFEDLFRIHQTILKKVPSVASPEVEEAFQTYKLTLKKNGILKFKERFEDIKTDIYGKRESKNKEKEEAESQLALEIQRKNFEQLVDRDDITSAVKALDNFLTQQETILSKKIKLP